MPSNQLAEHDKDDQEDEAGCLDVLQGAAPAASAGDLPDDDSSPSTTLEPCSIISTAGEQGMELPSLLRGRYLESRLHKVFANPERYPVCTEGMCRHASRIANRRCTGNEGTLQGTSGSLQSTGLQHVHLHTTVHSP